MVEEFVVPRFQAAGVECTVVASRHCGHARELAATLSYAGFDGLVAAGGDGTLHEVVNGMFARSDGARLPVSVIPLGSGNAFAADFRFAARRGAASKPESEEAILSWAVDRVVGGHVTSMDILEVEFNGKKLIAVVALFLGLFAEVDMVAEPLRFLGPVRLDLVSVWSLLKKHTVQFAANVTWADGRAEEISFNTLGAAVSLVQHWTSTMRANPQACLDDGYAELCSASVGASVDDTLAAFLQMDTGQRF